MEPGEFLWHVRWRGSRRCGTDLPLTQASVPGSSGRVAPALTNAVGWIWLGAVLNRPARAGGSADAHALDAIRSQWLSPPPPSPRPDLICVLK